ncbi:hypothetical protein LPW11_08565 [Geomonas sp. RF6]|uniref:hypothetical protein n=1 Tax=Geomonas sp. RF6 TaxID=2897342 RepID=UPI001E32A17D|nr:hypothetical protein [Geomonas sp. RF6]UFS72232.1 hypothetical protein LPW11_08565 [Geomonas sp. RF6]
MRARFLLAVIAIMIAGCSSTTVNHAWKDPGYKGQGIGSVMVVGLPMNSPVGHQCTDDFVAELEKRGIRATRGYSELPEQASQEAALAKTKDLGHEGLLVCRFMERKSEVDLYPSGGHSFFFGPMYWQPYDYVENKYDVFGTLLYQTSTGKPIWSADSDTLAGQSGQKTVQSYVKKMMKKMEEERVIQPTSRK